MLAVVIRAEHDTPDREYILRHRPGSVGPLAADSGRVLRLDPLALWLRFAALDVAGFRRPRIVEVQDRDKEDGQRLCLNRCIP